MNTPFLYLFFRAALILVVAFATLFLAPRSQAQTNTQYLLNLNFGAGVRTNIAATGHWTNDVWNIIPAATNVLNTYTPLSVTTLAYTTQTNLLWADSSNSTVTVTVTNLFTTNYVDLGDVMLDYALGAPHVLVDDYYYDECLMDYVYVYITADAKVNISNLPTNTYDIYVYGVRSFEAGGYSVKVGTNATSSVKWINYNEYGLPNVWLETTQYVKFTNVVVYTGADVLVNIEPSYGSYFISGMQIIQAGGKPLAPNISPAGSTHTNAVTVTISNPAPGSTTYYKLGSGAWTAYTGTFTLYDDVTVYAKTIYAGGVEGHTTSESYVFPDSEGDGLSDAYEYFLGTNPLLFDSDYDGRTDPQELVDGTNPASASDVLLVKFDHWKFSSTSWLSVAGNSPQLATNLHNIASYDGNGLLVNTNTNARLKYRDLELDSIPNINLRNGTVSLWFKPDWGSTNAGGAGPGVAARLIEMGAYTNNASYGQWLLGLNSAGTQIIFNTQGGGSETNHITASVSITSNTWHQVVLTYTPTNSILYLDGIAITNGPGVTFYPNATVRGDDGINVGSDREGNQQAKGLIDDLETYNYPLSADDVWESFEAVASRDSDGDGVSDLDEHEQGTSITVSNLALSIIITQPRPGSIIP